MANHRFPDYAQARNSVLQLQGDTPLLVLKYDGQPSPEAAYKCLAGRWTKLDLVK